MCTTTSIHKFLCEFNLNRGLKIIEQCISVVILANSFNSDSEWGSMRTTHKVIAISRSAHAKVNQWSFYGIDTARKRIELNYPRSPRSFTIGFLRHFAVLAMCEQRMLQTDIWFTQILGTDSMHLQLFCNSRFEFEAINEFRRRWSLIHYHLSFSHSLCVPVSLSLSRLMHSASL